MNYSSIWISPTIILTQKERNSHVMNEDTKFSLLFRLAVATAFTCVAVKWMVDQLDPNRDKKKKAKLQATKLMNKLRIKTNLQVKGVLLFQIPTDATFFDCFELLFSVIFCSMLA